MTLKRDITVLFPELIDQKEKIIERFYDGEFSHFFQITISKSSLNGLFTFHDENTRPENLLIRKNKKGLGKQIDLGIRLNYSRDRILVIEGKRLYNKYDKQYVSGGTGGICRFKREDHGEELEKACMVGFMQSESFQFWHQSINRWIKEEKPKSPKLKWAKDELLTPLTTIQSIVAKCTSSHRRITKKQIELFHFWVNMI